MSSSYDSTLLATNHRRTIHAQLGDHILCSALIAAILGFTGVAVAAAGIAKLFFVVFLVLFVVSLATHLSRGSSRV